MKGASGSCEVGVISSGRAFDCVLCLVLQSVCSTLWCTVADTCHSKLDGAVDGTKCGENKVSDMPPLLVKLNR